MEAQYAFTAQQQQQNLYFMRAGMDGLEGIQGGGQLNFAYPLAGIDYPGMNDVMCGRGAYW